VTENRFGLSRNIPADVKREVRRRSRFGCVMCRVGFYHYEHIDPEFKDAKAHDPDNICCLCGSCHDAVTRGRKSKAYVRKQYDQLRSTPATSAPLPKGPLDFHDGTAKLTIGGVRYSPAVKSILRLYGQDVMRVDPGDANSPGTISATFFDDTGLPILRLEENEWLSRTDSWDIQVVGSRLKVRQRGSRDSLILRLQPPGEIVVEWMDMRLTSFHILATEWTYAVGRHLSEEEVFWLSTHLRVRVSSPIGCAIEVGDPADIQRRYENWPPAGQGLATSDSKMVMQSGYGVGYIPLGILIASYCPSFDIGSTAIGSKKLSDMRKVIHKARTMEELGEFISLRRNS
jgi:hypothetical protein